MRRLVALLALVTLSACGSDSTTSPNSAAIAGTYSLKTVNGSALPFLIQSGTNSVKITSDAITIADGGTWSENGAYTQTINGQTSNQVVSDGGTWVRAGTQLTLVSSDSSTSYSGTFTGSSLNLGDGTLSFVFSK